MRHGPLAFILGVRPDVIRASIILELLQNSDCDLVFIWSGQHYSDNLKDIFFRELQVRPPDIELGIGAETDGDTVAKLLAVLPPALEALKPQAVVFLGDTNTVMGCLAAAQLNIPIVHIEGCMRSYDWRMPEEKYRTTIDHLSDVIYAYLEEYREQGIQEGLNPTNIVVTGNPIVDVLHQYYFDRIAYYDRLRTPEFFRQRGIERGQYLLMTCHRRENVHNLASLQRVLALAAASDRPVYFPASYRTQRVIADNHLAVPRNVIVVDPVGHDEFLLLMTSARGVLTDSGTVVEEACILQVPAVQLRRSTERPQVYDVGACVRFDPTDPMGSLLEVTLQKLERLRGRQWAHPFGDGTASRRIVEDTLRRLRDDGFDRHRRTDYHVDISRAYRDDGF